MDPELDEDECLPLLLLRFVGLRSRLLSLLPSFLLCLEFEPERREPRLSELEDWDPPDDELDDEDLPRFLRESSRDLLLLSRLYDSIYSL